MKTKVTKITRKTIEDKLNSYDFPHRFVVKYAVACAKLTNPTSKADLKALDLAERFSNGEDLSPKDLKEAANAASSAYYNVAYASSNVAYAAYAASSAYYAAAYAASSAAYAASSAYYAAAYAAAYNISYVAAYNVFRTEDYSKVYDLLLKMINENFTEFELLILKR